MVCNNNFYVKNVINILCDYRLIPLSNMNLDAKANALSRLMVVIFLVLLLFFDFKYCIMFLVFSLFIIIIFYYYNKRSMSRTEHYKNIPLRSGYRNTQTYNNHVLTSSDAREELLKNPPTAYRFCNDFEKIEVNDESYESRNQKLVGKANPKTLIAPVIIPPIADLSYWKANNLVNHSAVNSQSNYDVYNSGYQVSTCCGNADDLYIAQKEDYKNYLMQDLGNAPKGAPSQEPSREPSRAPTQAPTPTPYLMDDNCEDMDNIKFPYVRQNEPGYVDTACGYDPNQLKKNGLPTNFPSTIYDKTNPELKDYNENIFTQIIQPGVYTKSQIIEPINSNIGISFDQQFEPVTCKVGKKGIMYTEHDPRIMKVEKGPEEVYDPITESTVYDGRFSGYGTSYRSYTDDNLGQTRFYYDDVDAIRMPNYITRSNIDFMPEADTYGPMINEHGNELNSYIRGLANDQFTRSAMEFRTGLQRSLMRKVNANAWQQKMYPIQKSSQRMLGGMGRV